MRFSDRIGARGLGPEISIREDAPAELRSVLVDIAYEAGLDPHNLRSLVCRVLRRRADPGNWSAFPNVDGELRDYVETCQWYEVYDIAEAIYSDIAPSKQADVFAAELNEYFSRRGIGWQLNEGAIAVRGPESFEISLLEARQTLDAMGLSTSAREIHEALRDLSRRPEPDVTGAIQHALAALECTAREVCGDPRSTLGQILVRFPGIVPAPLDTAVEKLWGYASEVGRHLREGREPGYREAELAVAVAAAVANFLSHGSSKGRNAT